MQALERVDHLRVAPAPQADAFAPGTRAALSARFRPRRAAYVLRTLTPGELAVIADPADALILARIKRMPNARLRRFDRLVPADREHHQLFRVLQMNWLRDEEYLLSTRLGRWPTPKELFVDFMHHKNGLRFRAYFAMKYPDRVRQTRPSPAGA
jgi:hypothetical protein